LTCSSANLRTLTVQKQCICIGRAYEQDPVVEACLPCHYTCLNCTDGTSTKCTNCNTTAQRNLSSGSCVCMNGFYDNTVELCVACQYTCETCTTNTACLTCSGAAKRTSTGSFCGCLPGFYDNNISQTCLACHYSCKTCTNSS
jgi:proprotein convertase subtilisin/kexin type 5